MYKRNAIALAVMLVSINMYAQQTIELLSVSQQFSAPQKYNSEYMKDGVLQKYDSLHNSRYTKNANERVFSAQITIPYPLSDSNKWYTNINYDNFKVLSDNVMPTGVANPINIHGISVRTGLIHNFDKTRKIYIFFGPRMQGDFRNVNWRTFQVGGLVMFEKKYRDDFTMRFGLLYNQDFNSPFLTPVVYIYRQFTPKLKVIGTIPQDFRLYYQMKDKIAFGVQQFAAANIYHLGDRRYQDNAMLRMNVNLSLFGRYKISGPLCAELSAGYSYNRLYTQYGKGNTFPIRVPVMIPEGTKFPANTGFADGLFVSFRIVVDFPIPSGY